MASIPYEFFVVTRLIAEIRLIVLFICNAEHG